MSFALFKIKRRNIYGLALVDTWKLVHSPLNQEPFGNPLEVGLANHASVSRDGRWSEGSAGSG